MLVAFGLGLLLSIGIWVAVPYNNFAFNNSFVADGYLPEIAVLALLLLVLVLNPLLRRCCSGRMLSHRQMTLITAMMLFAVVLPGNGLFRFFPHNLAYTTLRINESVVLSEAIAESRLPASLFPDAIGFGEPSPVSRQLIEELDEGASIPWGAWLAPLLSWGSVIVALWVMMIGLGAMVYPQWRDRERLAFPLLRVYDALIETPREGESVPPVFRSRLFWIGCGVVLLLHSSNGLSIFTRGAFPAFPISWDVSGLFSESVWRHAPGFIKSSRLFFVFIGLAYFMPGRYSFSIWFFVLVAGLFVMVSTTYVPLFTFRVLYDMGAGALIAMGLGVVWLGREHYARVLRHAVGWRRQGEETRSDDTWAGRLFLGGCVLVCLWFVWAGAGVAWALLFLALAVLIMLMVARIVSESGLTYVWIIPLTASLLLGLFPQRWKDVATVFLQQAHLILVNRASAVSATVMMVLALGLGGGASTPKSSRRMAGLGLGVLLLGLLVCGAVHLHMGYSLYSSYDGAVMPITGRGATLMGMEPVLSLVTGRESASRLEPLRGILVGVALGGALLYLCSRFPAWPLHPVGLLFVHSSIGLRLVSSLFLGWLIKSLLVRYGGARAYRSALPLFLGLILGEVFASAIWTLVPVVQILLGADPATVPRMVIFQYT